MKALKTISLLSLILFSVISATATTTTAVAPTEPCGAVEIDENVQTKLSTKACCKKWVKVISALPQNLRQLALDSFDASKDADVCFNKETFTKGIKEAGKKDVKEKVEGLGKKIKEKAQKTACYKVSMTRDGAAVPDDQKKQLDQSTTEMGAALGKESQGTSAFVNAGLKHANNGFRYLWAKCSEVDSKCNKVNDYIVACQWSVEKCAEIASKFRSLLDSSSSADESLTKNTEEMRVAAVDTINKKGGCGCACGKKLRNLDALSRILSTAAPKIPPCKCPAQAGGMMSGERTPIGMTGGMTATMTGGMTGTRPLQKESKNTEMKAQWEELVKTYPDLNTVFTQIKATKVNFKQGLAQGFMQENKLGDKIKSFKCTSTNFLVQFTDTSVTCVKGGTCPDLTSWTVTSNQKKISIIAGCQGSRPLFFAWVITGDTSEVDPGKKCDPNNISSCNGDLPEGCNDDMAAQCKVSGLDTIKTAAVKYPDSCDPKSSDETCCVFLQQKLFGTGDMCLKLSKLQDIPSLVESTTTTLRDLSTSFKLVSPTAEKDLDDSVIAPDATVVTINSSTPTTVVNLDAAAAIDEKISMMNSRFVSIGFLIVALISLFF
jgi:hypothetical protein